jgi:hypothetical protein
MSNRVMASQCAVVYLPITPPPLVASCQRAGRCRSDQPGGCGGLLPNGARYRASSRFGQSFPARARITVAEAVRRALDHVGHATFWRPATEEDEPVDFKLELMVGVDVSDVFHFGEGGQKPGAGARGGRPAAESLLFLGQYY